MRLIFEAANAGPTTFIPHYNQQLQTGAPKNRSEQIQRGPMLVGIFGDDFHFPFWWALLSSRVEYVT